MGESCRRTVKWDTKEGPHYVPGEHNDPRLGQPSNREPQPRWHHGERNYNDQLEPLDAKEGPHYVPGEHNDPRLGRPANRESQPRWNLGERNYNDQVEPLDATMMWDGETTRSLGLHGWRQQRRHRSPERSQGRSCRTRRRSRSRSLEPGDQLRNGIVGAKSCTDDFSLYIDQNHKDAGDRSWRGRHDESYTFIRNPLPPQDAMSLEADVMDKVKSGTVQSSQGTMSTVEFTNYTLSLSQLRELYATLNASDIMRSIQSSLPSSSGADVVQPLVSSQLESYPDYENLYDPVKDSLELIESVLREQPDELKLDPSQNKVYSNEKSDMPSKFPLAGEPSGADLYITDCDNVGIDINSNHLSIKDEVGDCKSEENNRIKAQEKNKGQDSCNIEHIGGDGKADGKKENSDGKNVRTFKFALADFVKELLKPTWKGGNLSKEAHKTIVKKVVDKVTSSIQVVHIPQTQANIESYLSSSKPKISKLVQEYVDRFRKEKPIV